MLGIDNGIDEIISVDFFHSVIDRHTGNSLIKEKPVVKSEHQLQN